MESAPRSRIRHERPVLAAGVGAAVLGVTLLVTLRPDAPEIPGPEAVAAADAVRAEAALRADNRISRDLTRPSATVTAAARPSPAVTTPAPPPVLKVVGRMWVTAAVNIRSGPSAADDRIGSFKAVTRADVTGVKKSGWSQVVVGGRAGWVKSTFLSASKPAPAPARAAAGVSDAPCSISTDIEQHLSSNARSVYRAVCAAHGDSVSSFGGYRAGDDGDHGSGRALDIMVSGDPGWTIARYVQAHAEELGVTYVIYQQQMWMAGHSTGDWEGMEDRGSKTANHFDHVHVSVS